MFSSTMLKFAAAFLFAGIVLAAETEVSPKGKVIEKKSPKFEYGYAVADKNGNAQGHVESRDGVYALGRYYFHLPDGSGQKVTYFADNWGYHPLVSYASTAGRGSSRTQIALGEKAIAAFSDQQGLALDNGISDTSTLSVTAQPLSLSPLPNDLSGVSYTLVSPQQNLLLVSPTIATNIQQSYAPSANLIPVYDSKLELQPVLSTPQPIEVQPSSQSPQRNVQTVLNIPGLKKALNIGANQINNFQNAELNKKSNHTNDEVVNGTVTVTSTVTQGQNLQLSAYLQPPEEAASIYNSDYLGGHQQTYSTISPQLYSTTSMRPIVVSGQQKPQFTGELSINSIVTNNHGETGYNNIKQSQISFSSTTAAPSTTTDSVSDATIGTDSATQSSNSIAINQNVYNGIETNNSADQLAALQAGISVLQEEYKPVVESIEGESFSYKTEVDIQEGISLDVKQNPDGSLSLAGGFGQRIPNQQPTQYQGLAYERRLVNPTAQDIVQEKNPVLRQQKQANFIQQQEAEIQAVQRNIEQLQQQIISQIDAEHEAVEQQSEVQKDRRNHLESLKQIDALKKDQKNIHNAKKSVTPPDTAETVSNLQFATVQTPIAGESNQILLNPTLSPPLETASVASERGSLVNNQIEALPEVNVPSQTFGEVIHGGVSALPLVRPTAIITQHEVPSIPIGYPVLHKEQIKGLIPPPLTSQAQPVLVEPHPLETEPKLLPANSNTLFPVVVEKPTIVETTKVVEVPKPVIVKEPVPVQKLVEVQKPVPIPKPYPVEVTKYVPVEKPVPIPAPIAVSHPIPIPVAVPHPVQIPVPQLIPVPELLPITLKQFYPVFIQKPDTGKEAEVIHKETSAVVDLHIAPEVLTAGDKEVVVKPFKSDSSNRPGATVVIKPKTKSSSNQGSRLNGDLEQFWQKYFAQQGNLQYSDGLKLSGDGSITKYISPLLHSEAFRRNINRNKNALKNLRIEYGFKPPLRPSVELKEEVKPSIYGPSVRSD